MKTSLEHRFVELIPEVKDEGILYVSIEHCVAIHKCICGCGNDVVTPIDPSAWKLTFNGEAISLYPSIGNWDFECRSHYWISENKIKMAESRKDKKTEKVKKNDWAEFKKHFKKKRS